MQLHFNLKQLGLSLILHLEHHSKLKLLLMPVICRMSLISMLLKYSNGIFLLRLDVWFVGLGSLCVSKFQQGILV